MRTFTSPEFLDGPGGVMCEDRGRCNKVNLKHSSTVLRDDKGNQFSLSIMF